MPSPSPLHSVVVASVYNTRQAKELPGETSATLIVEAMRGALERAGLTPDDVDGVNANSPYGGINPRLAAHLLGGRPRWTGTDLGIGAVLEAAGAIATGQCHTVLLADGQAGRYRDHRSTSPWTRPENEFVACFGLYTAAEFALVARRHMHLYGTPAEALAEVAATIRQNGARHPEAVHYGRFVTREDVLRSRPIAEPFRLLDCAINSEGGSAMVLTTAERARDLDVTPVYLLGGALDRQGMAYVTAPVYDLYGRVGERAAAIAYRRAGIGPEDVDFAELYDPFSFEVIRQLEVLGFCREGEAADFVLEGGIRIGGDLPVATNGGLLSFSHAGTAQLLQKVIAAVEQLTGRHPPELTVPGAKIGMATNGGAGALFCDVLLLGLEAP